MLTCDRSYMAKRVYTVHRRRPTYQVIINMLEYRGTGTPSPQLIRIRTAKYASSTKLAIVGYGCCLSNKLRGSYIVIVGPLVASIPYAAYVEHSMERKHCLKRY